MSSGKGSAYMTWNGSGEQGENADNASRSLDRLLRETRRRLYAAAASADSEVFGEVQALPNSEVEAMERRLRGGLRSAELDHRRAVARLASPETPLPFADAASEFESPGRVSGRIGTQYSREASVDEGERSQLLGASLGKLGLSELGFTKGLPVGELPRFSAKPGQAVVVIGQNGRPEDALDVASRLGARMRAPYEIVLAGARTVNPGSGPRARSAEEFAQIREENPDAVVILSVVNSSVESHQRNAARIISSTEFAAVWAVIDARSDMGNVTRAVNDLPGEVEASMIALTHVWEAAKPGQVLECGIPVGLIDGAPASTALWSLVADDAYIRMVSKNKEQ
ncbi:hypothetical protein QP405_02525 [Gleimia europaea]|uniref:hypothetical protein n=1 Tax=Gleimia europaea TaxID=66228 RepID=UPI0026590192|nr:hypothetical protein [Gleimia europaea]MDK7142738.1 hypothetical protein [Gleimia europaea]